jgi:hypothetical protein
LLAISSNELLAKVEKRILGEFIRGKVMELMNWLFYYGRSSMAPRLRSGMRWISTCWPMKLGERDFGGYRILHADQH